MKYIIIKAEINKIYVEIPLELVIICAFFLFYTIHDRFLKYILNPSKNMKLAKSTKSKENHYIKTIILILQTHL